jgi:hypothetical protein
MVYNPIIVGLDLEGDQEIEAEDFCTSPPENITLYFGGWGTGNSAIATANNGTITGVGVGSTTNSALGDVILGGPDTKQCKPRPVNPSGGVNVGQTVYLYQTDCNTQPNADWTAGWGNLQNLLECSLSVPGPALPPGGGCVVNGTANGAPRNCYQVNQNNCSITYCPGPTRLINSTCTQFLDEFPVIVTTLPAGCTL